MDWHDTRFRLTLFFFEKVWAVLLLAFVAVLAGGLVAWVMAL